MPTFTGNTAVTTEAILAAAEFLVAIGGDESTPGNILGSNLISLIRNIDYTIADTAPTGKSEGALWYDTANDSLKTYDGSSWNAISGGGGGLTVAALKTLITSLTALTGGTAVSTSDELLLADDSDSDNLKRSTVEDIVYVAVKAILQQGTNVTLTDDDSGKEITIASKTFVEFWATNKLTDNASRTVQDTNAIQASNLNQSGVISTENISGFGRVYKTSALKSLIFVYTFNATQGVAFQIRYSDTAPTGSSDAKSFGTQCSQGNANTPTTCLEYNVPANRYFWFALSGGGSRIVNKRDLQVQVLY